MSSFPYRDLLISSKGAVVQKLLMRAAVTVCKGRVIMCCQDDSLNKCKNKCCVSAVAAISRWIQDMTKGKLIAAA